MTVEEYFDTDYIKYTEISKKRYCPYCGKEIIEREALEGHTLIYYYKCECEDALKAHEINLQIERLKYQLPKPKYKVDSRIVPYDEYVY